MIAFMAQFVQQDKCYIDNYFRIGEEQIYIYVYIINLFCLVGYSFFILWMTIFAIFYLFPL